MEYVGINLSLFCIGLIIFGVLLGIRNVEKRLKQMSGTFQNIDENLSKIVKHFERIDDKG